MKNFSNSWTQEIESLRKMRSEVVLLVDRTEDRLRNGKTAKTLALNDLLFGLKVALGIETIGTCYAIKYINGEKCLVEIEA